MRITPLDIEQKKFPIDYKGYAVGEVSAFLDVVREAFEETLGENAGLKERVALLEGQNKEYIKTNQWLMFRIDFYMGLEAEILKSVTYSPKEKREQFSRALKKGGKP